MNIFEFDDYRKFVRELLKSKPKQGYGLMRKLAAEIGVSTTFLSQVFSNKKTISLEQGLKIAEFFGFHDLEIDYFLKMISYDRAGTEALKRHLLRDLKKIRNEANRITNRIQIDGQISIQDQSQYYSSWANSAVRLALAIYGENIEKLSHSLGLNSKTINETIQFLLEIGILKRENGKIKNGLNKTHLEPESHFAKLHHKNWRLKAMEKMIEFKAQNLHYTSPLTFGVADAEIIRSKLVKLIAEVGEIIDPAPDEVLYCLNIDFFDVIK